MRRVVIDATVLVSAFLKARSGGASFDLLSLCEEGRLELYLSDEILAETADVLL
jgi:predicted nucleic acid-binding protein